MSKVTPGPYSVVNGKLFVATATARVEVLPTEAADRLNALLAAQRTCVRTIGSDPFELTLRQKAAIASARTAIAKAEGRS